jgi:hypothetical protein
MDNIVPLVVPLIPPLIDLITRGIDYYLKRKENQQQKYLQLRREVNQNLLALQEAECRAKGDLKIATPAYYDFVKQLDDTIISEFQAEPKVKTAVKKAGKNGDKVHPALCALGRSWEQIQDLKTYAAYKPGDKHQRVQLKRHLATLKKHLTILAEILKPL